MSNELSTVEEIAQKIANEISVLLRDAIKSMLTGTADQELKIEKVSTAQAAKELCLTEKSLRSMMKHGKLPIGVYDTKDGNEKADIVIYRGALDKYKEKIANV